MTTAIGIGLLALSACGTSTGMAPASDATELGDAFGSSGTGGNGATAPLGQASDSSPEMVQSTTGGGCVVTVTAQPPPVVDATISGDESLA